MVYMKKVLFLFMIVLLTACGGSGEEKEETEETKQTYEINEEFEFDYGNLDLELQNIYVEDGELKFGIWWKHWATNDKIHFEYFAHVKVEQNGEALERIDDNDSTLKQIEKGVIGKVELEYQLKDDSPISIEVFTLGEDQESHTIEVELD